MPYKFHWYDANHSVIWVTMEGKVTWDGFYAVFDDVLKELDGTSQRVDLIIHDTSGMPDGNAIPHIKSVMSKLGKRQHLKSIIIASNSQVMAVVKVISDIVGKFVSEQQIRKYVPSTEEALELIQEDRKKHGEKLIEI